MKTLRHTLIILLAVFLTAGQASFAALSVTITGDPVDFGTMVPGSYKSLYPEDTRYCSRMLVVTDTPGVWTVRAALPFDPANLSNPMAVIPSANLRWMSTYAGHWNGTISENMSAGLNHPPGAGYIPFSPVDELVYTSGSVAGQDDSVNAPNGTEIQFKYDLVVPPAAQAGRYSSTIRYTVTQ